MPSDPAGRSAMNYINFREASLLMGQMNRDKIRRITRGAVIAALYAVLTIVFQPISYGPVQVRVSEALTLLPFMLPEAIPGLFCGCVVANFFGGYGIVDMIVGSVATLLAAVVSARMPRLWLAAVPPVLFNAVFVGVMLHFLTELPLLMTCLYVGLGEAAACFLIGIPLMKIMMRRMSGTERQEDR